jgi:DNA-binding transcriptional regulator YdaS (Cro superfamily)
VSGRSRVEVRAELRAEEVRRAVAGDLRRLIEDSGIRPVALARAAGVSPSMVSRIMLAQRDASPETLARIAIALGGDVSVRLVPGAGIAIHDATQARMVDAFVHALHRRWTPFLEVPVRTPARGAIDVVLADSTDHGLIATEVQSQLRRAEQAVRWANEKAAALTSTDLYRMATAAVDDGDGSRPAISRLLVLRSTQATRAVVAELSASFAAAYPVEASVAVEALRGGLAWPGAAIVWMTVHGREAHLMDGPPRELRRAAAPA